MTYCLDTSETPMTPVLKPLVGVEARIQSNLVRVQLDLSFRVVSSRICVLIQSDLGCIQSDLGRVRLG